MSEDRKPRSCGLCGLAGHNRRTCGKIASTSTQSQMTSTPRSCSLCGRAGHNRRTCGKIASSRRRQRTTRSRTTRSRPARSNFSEMLKGPAEVVNWLDVNPRRGGSPCVLRRKFGYIVTHNKRLATLERNLGKLRSDLSCKSKLNRMDEQKLAVAEARVENQKKWLTFSIETMENALRYAVARVTPDSEDGILLREMRPSNYPAPDRVNKESLRSIRHYAAVMKDFKLAKAAVAGHSGSNAALQELMRRSSKIISYWKSRSGREKDDADQGAVVGLLEAAQRFDPCHSKFARFTTYAGNRLRRRTQVRAARDCRPGTTLVKDPNTGKRKQVARGVIDIAADGDDHVDRFHPTTVAANVGVVMDVRRALTRLGDEDAEIARLRFLCKETVKDIAEAMGVTQGVMRRRLGEIQRRLTSYLSDYRSTD